MVSVSVAAGRRSAAYALRQRKGHQHLVATTAALLFRSLPDASLVASIRLGRNSGCAPAPRTPRLPCPWQLRLARADRAPWGEFVDTLEHHHGHCSLLPIGDGSAHGLYAILKKQLNAMGIPTWVDEERDVPPNLATLWCFATDQGGDIAATRRFIKTDMVSMPKHIPFEAD